MEEPDDTDQLEAVETGEYRSCVGILLYLANDLPHCQHAIRHLSTGMSKPTKRLKDILRHLVSYLSGTKVVGLALKFKGDNVGVHHQYLENPDVLHLVFSDSDWASNKAHRRSISSGYLCCGSALLYSSSRTQKVVALSSGEAEVYAASSSACDSVLLSRILNYATGMSIMVHHLMDSAAARGILRRQGVGRIRHLSCRILWLQELVKCSRVFKKETDPDFSPLAHDVAAISGAKNLADLRTKRLGKQRLLELMGFCNMGTIEGDIFVPFHQDSVADASSNMISLVKSLRHHSGTHRQAEVALQIAQIVLLQSVLSPVPTMGMDDICKTSQDGDAYSCVLQTADAGMQWAEYFPYFFVGIMILATMAWIAYTVMSSNSKCLESRGMDDGHQEDVHMTDVSGNETVEDVENKLLDTISSICEEMETVSTEDVIRILFQLRTMYHAVLSGNTVLRNVCKRAIEIGDNGIINNAGINDASDLQGETLEIEIQNLVRFMTREMIPQEA